MTTDLLLAFERTEHHITSMGRCVTRMLDGDKHLFDEDLRTRYGDRAKLIEGDARNHAYSQPDPSLFHRYWLLGELEERPDIPITLSVLGFLPSLDHLPEDPLSYTNATPEAAVHAAAGLFVERMRKMHKESGYITNAGELDMAAALWEHLPHLGKALTKVACPRVGDDLSAISQRLRHLGAYARLLRESVEMYDVGQRNPAMKLIRAELRQA